MSSVCAGNCGVPPDVLIKRGELFYCNACLINNEHHQHVVVPSAPKKKRSASESSSSDELVAKTRRVREELEKCDCKDKRHCGSCQKCNTAWHCAQRDSTEKNQTLCKACYVAFVKAEREEVEKKTRELDEQRELLKDYEKDAKMAEAEKRTNRVYEALERQMELKWEEKDKVADLHEVNRELQAEVQELKKLVRILYRHRHLFVSANVSPLQRELWCHAGLSEKLESLVDRFD